MKIEKINDHQIRCTLTCEDLAERHLKISELAYGSEKTKALFQDMMLQANIDFGFEAEDIPLMIEAIPLSPEKIVLIITKVDSPDELDLRFSNFTNMDDVDGSMMQESFLPEPAPDDLSNLLEHIKQELSSKETTDSPRPEENSVPDKKQARLYAFTDLDQAIRAAQAVAPFYKGTSTLYREKKDRVYHLLLHQGSHSAVDFGRIVHTMDCFLEKESCTIGTEGFCKEHYKSVIPTKAIQTLAEIE